VSLLRWYDIHLPDVIPQWGMPCSWRGRWGHAVLEG